MMGTHYRDYLLLGSLIRIDDEYVFFPLNSI